LEEAMNRGQETGFGDWLADLMKKQMDADVAILSSGTLGLDYNLPPGSISRRHIADIFRYDGIVARRSVKASDVCRAIQQGIKKRGQGAWPHVSGVRVSIKASWPGKIGDVEVEFTKEPPDAAEKGFRRENKTAAAEVDCASDDKIVVAALPYLFCGGDGYELRPTDGEGLSEDKCRNEISKKPDNLVNPIKADNVAGRKIRKPTNPVNLSSMAEDAIVRAGNTGIEPTADGRIRWEWLD
jgi:hypothetical protein